MSQSAPSRGLLGFLDALRADGTVVGWARDPQAPGMALTIRLMRGVEVLAECEADQPRDDGNQGFRLVPPFGLQPADFLEGRVRVRALVPGRQAATTLAMTPRMREALEEAAGWEPTVAPRAPRPASPPEPPPLPEPEPAPLPVAVAPPAVPMPEPEPEPEPKTLAEPLPEFVPEPGPEPVPPPPIAAAPLPCHPALRPLQALAVRLEAADLATLHLVLPARAAVLDAEAEVGMLALEAEAGHLPLVARDWVPLRQAFARVAQPMTLWRHDGQRLTVEGMLAAVRLLVAVLRVRAAQEAIGLVRFEALLARADPSALPRRDIDLADGGAAAGLVFLGTTVRETEPALGDDIFADQPPPEPAIPAAPGFEAWRTPGAPLPWRIVLLTGPGLGGSAGPAALGWWLRRLAQECVVSEALGTASPDSVAEAMPDLVITLSVA